MRLFFRFIPLLFTAVLSGTGAQFLVIPGNALELAQGPSAVLANSINPAAMTIYDSGPLLCFAHGFWLAETELSSLRILSGRQDHRFGLTLNYVGLDDLELRSNPPTDEPLAYYGASGLALKGAFGWSAIGMEWGAAVQFIRVDMYTENSNGYALDLGLRKQVNNRLTIGAVLLNLGRMSDFYLEKPALPFRALTTFSYVYHREKFNHTVSVGGEWSNLVDGMVFHTSSLSKWRQMQFQLGSQLSKKTIVASAGVGIQFGIYSLNYGIRFGSQDLGLPQMIDLSIHLP